MSGRKALIIIAAVAALFHGTGRLTASEILVLDCIADAPMYGYELEKDRNYGTYQHMRIKDYQGIPFMQFDFEGLEGTIAVSCTLYISSVSGESAFCTDIISTIAVPWYEGTANNAVQEGASCYSYRFYPDSLWAGPGSNAQSVIKGENGSLINSKNICFPEGGGWAEVEIDPALAQQLINREAYGISLFGKGWANRDIYSRETGAGAYLEIEIEEGETDPPAPVTDLEVSVGDYHGRFTLSWTAPGDDGAEGTATLYEFRVGTEAIAGQEAWEAATPIADAPEPDTAGTAQTWTVGTLTPGGTFHIVMKARDDAWNWSEVSNGVIVTVPLDETPPGKIEDLAAAPGHGAGEIVLTWTAPGDDGSSGGVALSYELRLSQAEVTQANWDQASSYTVALKPGTPGSSESYTVSGLTPGETWYFALRALDEVPLTGEVSNCVSATAADADYNLWAAPACYKINPRTGKAFEYDEDAYDSDGGDAPYKGYNRVWDASKSKVSLLGGRNEFVGFQLVVDKVRLEELEDMDVSVSSLRGPMTIPAENIRLYREWYHKFDGAMYPDLLVPFAADGGVYQVNPFDIPDSMMQARVFDGVEQNNQAIFIDVYIPHETPPGAYSGTVTVRGAGVSTRQIALEVEVLNFELSDEINYAVEFNCYRDVGSPGWRVSHSSNPELHDSLETVVQRMLHEHRVYLNRLPYGQYATPQAAFRAAPALSDGIGSELTITDWTEYDKRFGPYFDGSAFKDNPRAGVPVSFYYLPFNCEWPVVMPKPKGPGVYTNQDYIDGWHKIVGEFESHINQKGWNRTNFQCYMNRKEHWGVIPWNLDEPTRPEDYVALNFFAGMFHAGLKHDGDAKMLYRLDIGYFSYLNGELDDAVELWVLNRVDYPENRVRLRNVAGDISWTYGSAPKIFQNIAGNYVDFFTNWARGARGFCYWDTFGAWSSTDNAWTRNHDGDTNIFYPGHAGATNMVGHVACPSLRMKNIRDAAEIMEALQVMAISSSYTVEESENFARRYNTHELDSYIDAEEELKRLVDGISGSGPEPPPVVEKSCDFSGDGAIAINDVIAFLLLARANPADESLDWNGDGSYSITDAISLLLDIRNGTCPDAAVLLAGDGGSGTVAKIKNLSEEDIEYLELMVSRMEFSEEEEAAFRLALYGDTPAASLPRAFSLAQNHPNPFNPSTTIGFTVPEGAVSKVNLKIYDIRGRLMRTLVDEVREPGAFSVFWDGADRAGGQAPSGVYIYRMQAGDFTQTRKMVLLK